MHPQRAGDRNAEDHPAGIGGFDHAAIALSASQRLETPGILLPQQKPLPAEPAATNSGGMRIVTKYGMSSRQGCSSLHRGSRLFRCNSLPPDQL